MRVFRLGICQKKKTIKTDLPLKQNYRSYQSK